MTTWEPPPVTEDWLTGEIYAPSEAVVLASLADQGRELIEREDDAAAALDAGEAFAVFLDTVLPRRIAARGRAEGILFALRNSGYSVYLRHGSAVAEPALGDELARLVWQYQPELCDLLEGEARAHVGVPSLPTVPRLAESPPLPLLPDHAGRPRPVPGDAVPQDGPRQLPG